MPVIRDWGTAIITALSNVLALLLCKVGFYRMSERMGLTCFEQRMGEDGFGCWEKWGSVSSCSFSWCLPPTRWACQQSVISSTSSLPISPTSSSRSWCSFWVPWPPPWCGHRAWSDGEHPD
jgi:hypothetical protein